MTISRGDARSLSSNATRTGAVVLGGRLEQEDDHFFVNKTDLTGLLENLTGQNVVIIVTSVEDQQEEWIKNCLTCGREYSGPKCPHCARVLSRLRG